MIDVDHFKTYNDTYGHKAGDELLIKIAQTIVSSINNRDLANRMGGDEFAIAIFDEITMNDINKIFDQINITIQANHGVSISIGVASTSDTIKTFNDLYVAADKALYKSKKNGRNQISIYE